MTKEGWEEAPPDGWGRGSPPPPTGGSFDSGLAVGLQALWGGLDRLGVKENDEANSHLYQPPFQRHHG